MQTAAETTGNNRAQRIRANVHPPPPQPPADAHAPFADQLRKHFLHIGRFPHIDAEQGAVMPVQHVHQPTDQFVARVQAAVAPNEAQHTLRVIGGGRNRLARARSVADVAATANDCFGGKLIQHELPTARPAPRESAHQFFPAAESRLPTAQVVRMPPHQHRPRVRSVTTGAPSFLHEIFQMRGRVQTAGTSSTGS